MKKGVDEISNRDIVLSLRDIHYSYDDSKGIINGISLDAHQGDVIAVLGASGCGKSTLLRCINLLEMPTSGEMSFLGRSFANSKSIAKEQITWLRTRVAMVFQQFNLWSHKTVLENIIEAPIHVLKKDKKDATTEARALLKRVGIAAELENQYPLRLSGGQQQRVAIARSLAMEPALILFDEPTSALDPTLVNEVLQVITSLAQEKRTMIVVTHEMEFARKVANRVIFLHKGRIEVDGTPKEVFENNKSRLLRSFLQQEIN